MSQSASLSLPHRSVLPLTLLPAQVCIPKPKVLGGVGEGRQGRKSSLLLPFHKPKALLGFPRFPKS